MMDHLASQPRPLGRAGQQPLRQVHRRTKTQALALQRWAGQHAISARSVADHLGVAAQTLADWNAQRHQRRLDVVPRGRPPHTPSIQVQSDVLELLEERRGRLGLPFPRAIRILTLYGAPDNFDGSRQRQILQLTGRPLPVGSGVLDSCSDVVR
jgi:hypothetical protein